MSTLKVSSVQHASAASPAITLDANGQATLNGLAFPTSGSLSGRNRIINGAIAVDQRLSGAVTFIAGAALAYSADRWYGYCTGANVIGQRVQGASAGQFRYQFAGAASVTGIGFGQRIELFNSAGLADSTATLSVDLANSVLTSVTWTAYYANTNNAFGTLASPTRTLIATGSFTVNSSVTRYNANISVPAAATTGIEIVFTVGAQTSGTWTIGNVQLEAGTVATPFERRSYGAELSLCQRYYEACSFQGGSFANSSSYLQVSVPFKVTKRATPTITNGAWTILTASQNTTAATVLVSANTDIVVFSPQVVGSLIAGNTAGSFTASSEL